MAGDWIKMRGDLSEDPAVIAMAARLGIDEFAVVGRLHNLWSWFDRQSRDGHAVGVTKEWIDARLRRDGFGTAMEQVGWLVFDESGVSIPNFDRHNGETAKTRAQGTKRQQKRRSVTPDVPQVSRSERDKSVTREEKRREESSSLRSEDKGAGALSVSDLVAEGVDLQDATDWLRARKDKGAKTLTPTAWDSVKSEAAKAGMTPAQAVSLSAKEQWRGFKASWLNEQGRGNTQARVPHKNAKHGGFEEKDYTAGVMEDGTIV